MKHLGIRLEDSDLHFKLHYIARYEGRSANGQIMFLIRKCIDEFESKHDKIQLPEGEERKPKPLSF
jgi:extradiol dioxygenase family protein